MKKVFYLFLASILVVTLTACGSKDDKNANKADNTPKTVEKEEIAAFSPLKGELIVTKEFSEDHDGIDIKAKKGTKVYSIFEGTVKETGTDKTKGKYVVIEYKDGTTVEYRHLNKISVKSGATVEAKTLIGTSGATGNVTGAVLHITVKDATGTVVDPISLKLQEW